MRPPICCICNKRLADEDDGALIYFKKRPSDIIWIKKMEKKGMVGHPPYADWFCNEHHTQAIELKYLTIDEAMILLLES
jgi:hypothetical protein